jgi:hypothetical protein
MDVPEEIASTRDAALARPPVARSQRWLALPSGLVLAICLFLPVVRACGDAMPPFVIPLLWPPYALGAAVAALATAATLRGLRNALFVTRIAAVCAAMMWLGWHALSGELDTLVLAVAIGPGLLLATLGGGVESKAARALVIIGASCTAFFALLVSDPDTMFGAWISLGASIAIAAAGAVWIVEHAVRGRRHR